MTRFRVCFVVLECFLSLYEDFHPCRCGIDRQEYLLSRIR